MSGGKAMTFGPDGLLYQSTKNFMRIYNSATGTIVSTIQPMNGGDAMAFGADGLLYQSTPTAMRVYNPATGLIASTDLTMNGGKAMAFTDLPDTDGDGIPDYIDNCISKANPNQEDANGDGCGDACIKASWCGPPACLNM